MTAVAQQDLFGAAPPDAPEAEAEASSGRRRRRPQPVVETSEGETQGEAPPEPPAPPPASSALVAPAPPLPPAPLVAMEPARSQVPMAIRSRVYSSRLREFLDLEVLLGKAKSDYAKDGGQTAANLERIAGLSRQHREMADALERAENPEDLRRDILSILAHQTSELIKSVADEFRLLREHLERRDPEAAVRDAFRRVGERVADAHRENQRCLTELLPAPAPRGRGPAGGR